MDTVQRTVEILTTAEKALAEAASDVAHAGQYDAASFLIELARAVSSLSVEARGRLAPEVTDARVEAKAPRASVVSDLSRVAQPLGRQRKKASYPMFLREGESLVKVGWSRSEKSEYEHKSPKKVLPILAEVIAKAGARGKRFSMDRVLPLMDPDDGTRVPDYQVYLCLAWFRTLGFLIQHGRQGYSLASKAPVVPLLETHWLSLPSR